MKKPLALVQLALFGAIIFVLAFTPFIGYIPLGVTRATIVHIPVIVGSILLGPKKGAVLGFLFGVTSLIINTVTPTLTSFVFSPFYSAGEFGGNWASLVICFIPRILVGVVPYYVYKGFERTADGSTKRQTAGLAVAGLAGSMVNTILVMGLIYFLFGASYAAAKEISYHVLHLTILSVIAINGIPEAIIAALLTVAICRVLLHTTRRAA